VIAAFSIRAIRFYLAATAFPSFRAAFFFLSQAGAVSSRSLYLLHRFLFSSHPRRSSRPFKYSFKIIYRHLFFASPSLSIYLRINFFSSPSSLSALDIHRR
jgi:hypothetical protein